MEVVEELRLLNSGGFRAAEVFRPRMFSSCGGCRGAEVFKARRFSSNRGF